MSALSTAVVMARGLGTRMRAEDAGASGLTATQAAAAAQGAKAMMPLNGRPFLDHSLSELADAGIRDVCLVIGPEHQAIREYYRSLELDRLSISFAVQEQPKGTADAVAAARAWVGERRFLVVNGDNLYSADVVRALADVDGNAMPGYDKAALIAASNIPAERVASFALVHSANGLLTSLEEKPAPDVVAAAGEHAQISMNMFAFTPEIFDSCARIAPSVRGELELVTAVLDLVARGIDMRVVPVDSGVLDLARRDDVAVVESLLADREVRL